MARPDEQAADATGAARGAAAYDSTGRWRKPKPVVVATSELDEAAQLADVWAAQIREPADLIGAALPA